MVSKTISQETQNPNKIATRLMELILAINIGFIILSVFIGGVPYMFVTALGTMVALIFLLPASFFVYWLSNKYKNLITICNVMGLLIIPLIIPIFRFLLSFKGLLNCAHNTNCNLPGLDLVATPIVMMVTFNYYLIIKFRPKLSLIILNIVLFVFLVIAMFYFAPYILNTPDPWKFKG